MFITEFLKDVKVINENTGEAVIHDDEGVKRKGSHLNINAEVLAVLNKYGVEYRRGTEVEYPEIEGHAV